MISLNTFIGQIPKIGPKYQKKLEKLGVKTVQDLLFYFPARYDDFSNIIPINKVKNGFTACVQGEILEIGTTKSFKKWMDITEATIQDESGQIQAIWFNQPFIENSLKEGDFVCLAGKVSLGKGGVYFNSPAYEKINELEENPSTPLRTSNNLTHTGRIVPVYTETKGLTSRWLRYIIKPLLAAFYKDVPEILPPDIIKKHKFLPIKEALWQAHFPDSFESADAAKARFSFEQLFLLQLFVLKEKVKLMQKKAIACPMDVELMKQFTSSLPFVLTDSQKQCSYQILKDLEKPIPMHRLLEGDVGSGKTVVATMAALNIAKHGHQTAFMAPTEILAKQHFKTITKLLENFDAAIALLTSKESKLWETGSPTIKCKELLEKLASGKIDILIGTHTLIQKNVEFKNLAFVILDEQHRFGVNQRAELIRRKTVPHLLSMTATPIPRTLALTVYGDLDLSIIKEMPKDRKKIKTVIVEPGQRKEAYDFIKKEVSEGKGVFVICPKIEARNSKLEAGMTAGSPALSHVEGFAPRNYQFSLSSAAEIKSVTQEYEKLSKEIFPDLRITMLHGKMKSQEKEKIMLDFKHGEIDILVSTSVVEVGVDVPRATIMMIEGAERFGLAQLHQFRGRVGRSDMQSYCFLFTTSPVQLNRKRLKALVQSNSGFELAEKDLQIRGPGSLYGSQQWGIPDMAMQGLSNIFLVEKTRTAAKELLEKDPTLAQYPLLAERVKHFSQQVHFE